MADTLSNYFIAYGYLAIFGIILLQELGMPGLPNEFVLFYFGYLSRKAGLSYPLIICLAVTADMAGSLILYYLFYYGREWLSRIKPSWIKVPTNKVNTLKSKVASHNGRNIFVAKLTPFIRSYLPVVAGLLKVDQALYMRIVLLTAFIWTGGWVTLGWILYFKK
jgi:membrane-associated protein